jgi:hypothetical protein
MKANSAKFVILLIVLSVGLNTGRSVDAVWQLSRPNWQARLTPTVTKGLYWFQVGVSAASALGWRESYGRPVTGASVEIRILDNQPIRHPDTDLSYWVGLDLPNDAFIQVGYEVNPSINRGKPTWFWEYFPPGTAREGSVRFLGKSGSIVAANGTWVKFAIASEGTTWSAYVNSMFVGSTDLKVKDSGSNGPYASAEVAGTRETDNILGPVEFRNLSYRDTSSAWHPADAAVSLCCYSVRSDMLPTNTQYPYGVAGIPGENNHWLAGSSLPIEERGKYIWPWYKVTVSSRFNSTTSAEWFVKGSTVQPSAVNLVPVNKAERYALTGWSANGSPSQSTQFVVNTDLNLSAIYSRQFLVTIDSTYGVPHGSGWYYDGSSATFWVDPTSITAPGCTGSLGVKIVLVGWNGDFVGPIGRDGKSTFRVDSPKYVQAVWSVNYTPLIITVGEVIAPVALVVFLASKQGKSAMRATLRILSRKTEVYCQNCGAKIPTDSKYCRECGNPT